MIPFPLTIAEIDGVTCYSEPYPVLEFVWNRDGSVSMIADRAVIRTWNTASEFNQFASKSIEILDGVHWVTFS